MIKRAVIPKLDALLEADFVQIEPRLLAYFMSRLGDDSVAAAYRAGVDVYRDIAAGFYGKTAAEITPDERQKAKRMFLSLMYGGGLRTLQAQGYTQTQARELYNNFHAYLPGMRRVSNPPPKGGWATYEPGAIERVLERKGYIETLAGRRIRPEPHGEHKMLNALIQGSAADIMKRALRRVHARLGEEGFESHIILTIHDSLLFDVREHELRRLVAALPGLMDEPTVSEIVPIEVEFEVSYGTWADKAVPEWLSE